MLVAGKKRLCCCLSLAHPTVGRGTVPEAALGYTQA